MAFTGGYHLQPIKEAKERCLASLHSDRQEDTHEEFLEHVLEACKDAARLFRNNIACFRVPGHLDTGPIIHQLKEGGFMVHYSFGGLLKVGWGFDPHREQLERRQSEQDPLNIAKVDELDRCVLDAVKHMGLSHTSVEMHPHLPRSAVAHFSWL